MAENFTIRVSLLRGNHILAEHVAAVAPTEAPQDAFDVARNAKSVLKAQGAQVRDLRELLAANTFAHDRTRCELLSCHAALKAAGLSPPPLESEDPAFFYQQGESASPPPEPEPVAGPAPMYRKVLRGADGRIAGTIDVAISRGSMAAKLVSAEAARALAE